MLSEPDIRAQVFAAFRAEQAEHRQAISELLLDLEREPQHSDRRARLDQLFRAAHSLKGGARAAGLPAVEQLAHRIEDMFAAVRRGTLALTPDLCDPIYAVLDGIGNLVEQAAAGHEPDSALSSELLSALSASDAAGLQTPRLAGVAPSSGAAPASPAEGQPAGHPAAGAETVRLPVAVLDGLMNEAGELMVCALRARQLARDVQALQLAPARWQRGWRRVGPAVAHLRERRAALEPVVHHLDARSGGAGLRIGTPLPEPGRPFHAAPAAAGAPGPLVEALDQANATIGDLAARLAQLERQAKEDAARLTTVIDRLHAQVRRTRMLPLATLISPLRLQAREMARAAGKQVALELDDPGVEADRQVLEQLREVLLHLLRNAVDHGIESPEARLAAGKPACGTILLRAVVAGDRLTLTLADDGAGVDLAAIGRQAVAGGLLNAAELVAADEPTLRDLIFLPSFSTRQTVSALSGRGVGLDIVRSCVERMQGRVAVASRQGAGTTFTVEVPLSLASSRGLLLQAGNADYFLPLEAVRRIITLAPAQIQTLKGRPVIPIDGRPLPVVHLADLLGGTERRPADDAYRLAVIVSSGERQIACLVSAILDEQELVVHRLPAPLRRVRFLSGASILADGRVVPIIDAVDLARAAEGATQRLAQQAAATPQERRVPVIVVADDSITTRTLEKNILEAAGYRVALATDGQEALEALHQLADSGGCDLLLSDVDMPRLSGFDLTAQVRADARLRHLPVVLVTSLDSPADRARGVSAGADAYIVKHAFDQQTLLDTIARLI